VQQRSWNRKSSHNAQVYAVTDIDRTAQQVLAAHAGSSEPVHIFGDVLGRLTAQDRQMLGEMEHEVLEEFQALEGLRRDGNIERQDCEDAKTSQAYLPQFRGAQRSMLSRLLLNS